MGENDGEQLVVADCDDELVEAGMSIQGMMVEAVVVVIEGGDTGLV